MSEPLFRLGVSRTASREISTFWERLRNWLRRTPPPAPRTAAIPRPPRSVLLSRTLAENTGEAPASGRAKSAPRK